MSVHNYRLVCPNGLFFSKGQICEKCTKGFMEINCIRQNCEDSIAKSIGYSMRNFWARKRKLYHNYVDLYLCLTDFQKNKLIQNGFSSNRIRVIPNFHVIKNKMIENDKKDYVVVVGRISPEKGIENLLKAASKLKHIPFYIAGELRKDYSIKSKVPENVVFLGNLTKNELELLYCEASFLVHPSRCYEGFPMVFPEAMSFNLPIIAPDMAGYPEIVENLVNGLLFIPDNVESLSDKINSLWDNPALRQRLAENARIKLEKDYSFDRYSRELIDWYKFVISKKSQKLN